MASKVSARVPDELRCQVDGILAAMGSNTTQLINAAYEYVAQTGALPKSNIRTRSAGESDQDVVDALRERISATTFAVSEQYFEGRTYESILEEELREAYETLA